MSAFLRKYATATHIYLPIIKRGVVDLAVSADWTPATGDVKVSIDGGAAANIGTLPTAIAMGNTAQWDFTIASGEVTGKKITITVADSATKAVEDQCFLIETYGHASAEYALDLTDGVRAGLTAMPNAAANANGGLPVLSSSGTTLAYTISTLTTYTGNTVQTGDSYARIGATGSGLTSLATQASVDDLPTNSELTSAFTQIKGATWSSTTDTLEAIRDRGDAAWTTGSGGSSVTVTPISTYIASRVESAQIEAYFAENGWTIGPVVVTDSDGTAVSLAAYSGLLRFTVETTAGVDVYTTTSVTISGTSNNQWSVTGNSAITATAPNVLRWSLRAIDTGLNVLLGRGPLKVVAAANQDS